MINITQSANKVGRMSQELLDEPRLQMKMRQEKKAHVTRDDYEYILDLLFTECSGYFNVVIPVGRDCEHNLNLEGRIEYEMVCGGSSDDAYEEAVIILEWYECRTIACENGRELDYMRGDLCGHDFDPSRINGTSRPMTE